MKHIFTLQVDWKQILFYCAAAWKRHDAETSSLKDLSGMITIHHVRAHDQLCVSTTNSGEEHCELSFSPRASPATWWGRSSSTETNPVTVLHRRVHSVEDHLMPSPASLSELWDDEREKGRGNTQECKVLCQTSNAFLTADKTSPWKTHVTNRREILALPLRIGPLGKHQPPDTHTHTLADLHAHKHSLVLRFLCSDSTISEL